MNIDFRYINLVKVSVINKGFTTHYQLYMAAVTSTMFLSAAHVFTCFTQQF